MHQERPQSTTDIVPYPVTTRSETLAVPQTKLRAADTSNETAGQEPALQPIHREVNREMFHEFEGESEQPRPPIRIEIQEEDSGLRNVEGTGMEAEVITSPPEYTVSEPRVNTQI